MQGAENLPELQAYLAWYDGERPNDPSTDGGNDERLPQVPLRSEVNIELNFPPNFEGLVLGCIDADFCK